MRTPPSLRWAKFIAPSPPHSNGVRFTPSDIVCVKHLFLFLRYDYHKLLEKSKLTVPCMYSGFCDTIVIHHYYCVMDYIHYNELSVENGKYQR
jgi:hypothetical protein